MRISGQNLLDGHTMNPLGTYQNTNNEFIFLYAVGLYFFLLIMERNMCKGYSLIN